MQIGDFTSEIQRRWKRISFAGAIGILAGCALAALAPPKGVDLRQTVHSPAQYQIVHVKDDEIERLKTRNRRLEAFVEVLRQRVERETPAHHRNRNPNQETVLGQ